MNSTWTARFWIALTTVAFMCTENESRKRMGTIPSGAIMT